MPATEPGSLNNTSWNGDVEETAITNDPANKGFPARTQAGDLVFIVKQKRVNGILKLMIDQDGNQWIDNGVEGSLVPFPTLEEETVVAEMTEETVEDSDVVDVDDVEQIEGYVITEDAAGVIEAATAATGGETIELTSSDDLTSAA